MPQDDHGSALPPGFVPSQRAWELAPELDPAILKVVRKPSRYLGGELGQTVKDLRRVRSVVGLCYPDLYEIGMSHVGLKILYSLLNDDPEIAAERVYAVAPDMEAQLRQRGLVLRTLESRVPLKDLDVLGFTLQYELSYSNLLQVLDLGGIPLRVADRSADHPLVIAGGPCSFNPEPVAPFLDAVCLGDGEITLPAVVAAHQRWKGSGASRQDLLWSLTEIPGVYVPSLYTVHYEADGRVAAVEPAPGLPSRIRKAILPDLDAAHYHTRTPVPFMQVVHDRVGVEIQRGCMRGCRFCQAGYIYRPVRQRSPARIAELVRQGLKATGLEEYSLLSLSAGDYSCMEPLLSTLMDEHERQRTAISLPSMRLETLSPGIMDQIDRVRKTSFTVAPEAASDRMRGVINKVIDEDVLLDMVGEVFSRGWKGLKFYFMLGLPTEQWDDLQAMIELGRRALQRARRHNRGANITVAVSTFVPKAHTPFQWATQANLDQIRDKQRFLKQGLRRAKLGFRYHQADSSVMEGIFSRGDRRCADALEAAYRRGARLDGWQEHLNLDAWGAAFDEVGLEPRAYNQRLRDQAEVFPWQHIDIGVKPEWLWDDWMDALEAGFVPDCSTEPCYDCGVCDHKTIHNRVFAEATPGATPKHRLRKAYGAPRKQVDPQFVQLPRPPRKKATGVVDAVPPAGMSPGSAGARGTRADYEGRRAEGDGVVAVVPHGHPSSRAPKIDGENIDWRDVWDTRLPPTWRVHLQIRYGKRGELIHLGHLEVMAAFRRAFKRVGAPVLWSQGFRPSMKLGFGSPLPTGMGSTAEYMELELKKPLVVDPFTEQLRRAMPAGLPILEVVELPVGTRAVATRISHFQYRVSPPEGGAGAVADALRWFEGGGPLRIEIVKKKQTVEVDLREVVEALGLDDGALVLDLRAIGAGARVRDVLRGLLGEEAAAATGAWQVSRCGVRFHEAAPKPGASPSSRDAHSGGGVVQP